MFIGGNIAFDSCYVMLESMFFMEKLREQFQNTFMKYLRGETLNKKKYLRNKK